MEKPTLANRGSLEWGKFRLNRQGEPVVAVSNEDEVKVKTVTITDSGNSKLVEGEAGKSISLKGFMLSREGGSSVTISFRDGDDGELKYSVYLKDDGDFISYDFSHIWLLDTNKPLYVYASGACNVHVTVEYDGPEDSRQESETIVDVQSIAEALSLEPNKKITDAITITEAEIEGVGKGLSDVQPISEGLVPTSATARELTDSVDIVAETITPAILPEVETKSLSDSISISEVVGASRSARLSDEIAIDDTDMERVYVNNAE